MFNHLRALFTLAGIAVVCAMAPPAAAVNHNEAVDGDLSGDRLNPTQLVLSAGTNSLTATTGVFLNEQEEEETDLEYVRIDLPANHQLVSILMQGYTSFDTTAFIGVQSGTTFTFDPGDAISNVGNLDGYAHFGPGAGHDPGDDLLPDIGAGPGSIGFTPPLTGTSYTFWIQQTGALTDYQLDFIVTSIPEPASAFLMCTALVAAAHCRRRRWRAEPT